MIELAWPWVLLFLPLPLLARGLLPRAEVVPGGALRLPFLHELPEMAFGGRAFATPWRQTLAGIAWVLLVVAASQPRWLGEPLNLPLAGRDLMLAVDLSGSMEEEDYQLNGRRANRLEVVKRVAGRFIERREGDRLGLILFGSRAYPQTPLTHDLQTVRALLEESVIGLAGRDTAIGDAIALAVKRLLGAAEQNRVLILLTDGANTAGLMHPLEAARLAAQAKVRIYTIGIGGGPVGVSTPFGVLMRQPSDLDPTTLQAIARETGGRFFQATDAEQLEAIYEELDRLEPTTRDSRIHRPMTSLYPWPAGLALLLSLGLALTAAGWPMMRTGRTDAA